MISGLLLLDKPLGITSHKAVSRGRAALQTKKIGHAGTLDPLATGLLLLGVGQGTRLLEYLVGCDKVYEAEITLGATSNTFDAEGEIKKTLPRKEITLSQIKKILPQFRGQISQIPPKFSALKIAGTPAHRLARQGQEVALQARQITIHTLEVLDFSFPILRLRVRCSSGTYIRSLAHDLGQALGCGAYLSALSRTQVGDYLLSEATQIEDISPSSLLPLEKMISHLPRLDLNPAQFEEIRFGRPLQELKREEDKLAAFYEERLVSILQRSENLFRVEKNLF